MTISKRLLIALGALALALTVAVSAFFLGGPRPGLAASGGLLPGAAPPAAPAFGPALTLPAGEMVSPSAALVGSAPGGPAAFGDDGFVRAAAGYFGVSADRLRQDLRERGSLQAVAAQYGQDTTAGRAGLQAALTTALRQQGADHGAGTTQADQLAQAFGQDFARLYAAPWGQGRPAAPPAIPGLPLAPGMPGLPSAAPTT